MKSERIDELILNGKRYRIERFQSGGLFNKDPFYKIKVSENGKQAIITDRFDSLPSVNQYILMHAVDRLQ